MSGSCQEALLDDREWSERPSLLSGSGREALSNVQE